MNSTTHLLLLINGDALSMTSSVESAFGSRIMSQNLFLIIGTDFHLNIKTIMIKLQNSLNLKDLLQCHQQLFSTKTIIYLHYLLPGEKYHQLCSTNNSRLIDFDFNPTNSVSEPRFVNTGRGLILRKINFQLK